VAAADVGHLGAPFELLQDAFERREPGGDEVGVVAGPEETLAAGEDVVAVLMPADADPFAVPDGTADEIADFVKGLLKKRPRSLDEQVNRNAAIRQAVEKILKQEKDGKSDAAKFAFGISLIPLCIGGLAQSLGAKSSRVWTTVGLVLAAYWLLPQAQHDALFGHFESNIEMFVGSGIMIVISFTLIIIALGFGWAGLGDSVFDLAYLQTLGMMKSEELVGGNERAINLATQGLVLGGEIKMHGRKHAS